MSRGQERETQAEQLNEAFNVSLPMAQYLLNAGRRVSGEGHLNAAAVLWEMAQGKLGENKGASILKVLTQKSQGETLSSLNERSRQLSSDGETYGTITIKGESFAYGRSLAEVFKNAPRVSRSGVFTTADFVLAEAESLNSILVRTLSETGNVLVDQSLLYALAGQIKVLEEGSVCVENSYRQPEERNETFVQSKGLEGISLPPLAAVDLITKTAESPRRELVIKKDSVSDLLASIQRQPITVLVCEDLLAQEIIEATAGQLALSDRSLFNIKNIIGLDPTSLQADPVSIIEKGIIAADGGVLSLPHAHVHLAQVDRLKRAISSKKIKLVTVLSEEEWKKQRNESYFSGLRPLYPSVPNVDEATRIFSSQREALQASLSPNGVIAIGPEAIRTACKLAHRYLREIPFLFACRELLGRAVAEVMVRHSFDQVGDDRVLPDMSIDADDVAIAVEKLTGIKVLVDNPERYLRMEKDLSKRIIHQEEAIRAVSEAIRRSKAGFGDPNRPIGSFMFMGPSGSGKTELAKALAEFMFGNEREIIVFDMSEYAEKHNVARLIGSPPGYVAHEEGGQLTEAVRKKPYSVVLFDEIEKAHPESWNILLQVLEEGRLTDGQGRRIDFSQTVIILTGNVGSRFFAVEQDVTSEQLMAAVQEEIKATFRPEQLNRIDKVVVFNSLRPQDLLKIVDLQVGKLNKRLAERGLEIDLTPGAKKYLAERGYDPIYGARPLRREMDNLTSQLAEEVLRGRYKQGKVIRVGVEKGKLIFNKRNKKTS